MAVDNALSGLFFGFDRLNAVVADFERRLEFAATENATDAGKIDAAGVQRYEDGTLGPLDLTPGLTAQQVAYNRSASNAYVTRQRLDAEHRASEFMRKNQLNPDGFKADWEAYMSGTLGKVGSERTAAALALDLEAIGNKAYGGLADAKFKYDREEQRTTFVDRAGQLKIQANSLAARSGRYDSEEIKSLQAEVDGIFAVLVSDKHMLPADARKAQREFAQSTALSAWRTQVEATYNAGRTPLGPGNYAAAIEKARELSWQASEMLGVDPKQAQEYLMGLASIAQQNKQALAAERREQMQIDNEKRAAAAHAQALQNKAQSEAAEDLQFRLFMSGANGARPSLLPPAGPSGDRIGGDAAADRLEGGDQPPAVFRNIDELVKKVGKGRAVELLRQEQIYNEQRQRSATAAKAADERAMLDHIGLATRITSEDGKVGIRLPNGVEIFDPSKLPGDDLARARFADGFYKRLKSVADEQKTRDDARLGQQLSEARGMIDNVAAEVISGREQKSTLATAVAGIADRAGDITLPEAERAKWQATHDHAQKKMAEVDKLFSTRSDATWKASVGAGMTNEERKAHVDLMGFDLSKPDASVDAAQKRVGQMLEDLAHRRYQIDERNAQFIASTLMAGAPRGVRGTMALEKTLAVIDRIGQALPEQRAMFDAEMVKVVPGWADIQATARVARLLYDTANKEAVIDGKPQQTAAITWQDAYKQAEKSISERRAGIASAPRGMTSEEAKAWISDNASKVAPGLVEGTDWFSRATWAMGTGRLAVPQAMADEFARNVTDFSLTQQGAPPGEATRMAAVKLMEQGWAPSKFKTPPGEVQLWSKVQSIFTKKGLEWHMEQEKLQYGSEALVTYAAGIMAKERGLKPEDAWKAAENGYIRPWQEGEGSKVQFLTIDPKTKRVQWLMRDNQIMTIDVRSREFADFHRELEAETFTRARDFDINLPKMRFQGAPLGWGGVTSLDALKDVVVGGPIPFGNLFRDRIANPEVGGSGAKRAFEILYERSTAPRSPNIRGDAGDDDLEGGSTMDRLMATAKGDGWTAAAAMVLRQRMQEGKIVGDITDEGIERVARFLRVRGMKGMGLQLLDAADPERIIKSLGGRPE